MRNEDVQDILNDLENSYDTISEKFSQTRKHFWSDLEFIKEYAHDGDRILDYGCGNGRLLELFSDKKNIDYLGVDISQKLINLARNPVKSLRSHGASSKQDKKIRFEKIDSSQDKLPFEDDFFDVVYAIAVLHHLPSRELREKIVKELYRALKPNGYLVASVWELSNRKNIKKALLKNWVKKLLNLSKLDWDDCYVSFQCNKGVKMERFYHIFKVSEIKKLFQRAGFLVEKCEVVNGKNIVVVGKKN